MTLFRMVLDLVPQAAERGDGLRLSPGERVVAIGDSITESGGYLRAVEAVFAQRYPELRIPEFVNAGIGGQQAADLAERFERDVVQRLPAVVTISVGINDVWHRLDEPDDPAVLERFERHVERMVRKAGDAGIRVLLLSPTVIEEDPDSEGNRRLATYAEAGGRIARRSGCGFVDLHGLFLEAIRRRHGEGGNAPRLTCDGVHMAPPGDALMAVGVLRALGVPDADIAATDLTGALASS